MIAPRTQLTAFIARFSPDIAPLARAALATMRKRLPGAVEFIYDNYNNLVVGFGPTERPSEAIFSIVMYPRSVGLCFLQGAHLPDPRKRLEGKGSVVRHVRLTSAATLEEPAVKQLITRALDLAIVPIDPKKKRQMLIRAIAARQRPRRPANDLRK